MNVNLGPEKQGNHRLVRQISVVRKLLECVIKDRVTEHLECFQLIVESQQGFVKPDKPD